DGRLLVGYDPDNWVDVGGPLVFACGRIFYMSPGMGVLRHGRDSLNFPWENLPFCVEDISGNPVRVIPVGLGSSASFSMGERPYLLTSSTQPAVTDLQKMWDPGLRYSGVTI